MDLSQVSRTAISTLIGRVVESGRENAVFHDPMAAVCLERLLVAASVDEERLILRQKRLLEGAQAIHAKAMIRRVIAFDHGADQFIANHPNCTVINLGCGFDTRYWRIQNEGIRYIEIDLPEMIALKREILKDQLPYELVGCSVLDATWINHVTARGQSGFLFVAEGLFMYLPRTDVVTLFQQLAQRFDRSQLILDVVPEKFTRGLWKKLIALETKYTWGLETTYVYGINDPREVETYAPGLRVLGAVKGGMGMGPIVRVAINGERGTPPSLP